VVWSPRPRSSSKAKSIKANIRFVHMERRYAMPRSRGLTFVTCNFPSSL
jgi:hypothetical protein